MFRVGWATVFETGLESAGVPEGTEGLTGGHIAAYPPETIREMLDWLDRYLAH